MISFPRSAGRRIRLRELAGGTCGRTMVGRGVPPSRKEKKQFERKNEMTKKLAMTVGTARRAVRNLALLAAVAVAIGARADEETVGGYTWTSQIDMDAF